MADPNALYAEFLRLAGQGDEAGARTFLADRIMDFPEDVRGKITLAFFEEALVAKAASARALAQVHDEGIEALREIIAAEKEVTNQERIEELKKQLGSN